MDMEVGREAKGEGKRERERERVAARSDRDGEHRQQGGELEGEMGEEDEEEAQQSVCLSSQTSSSD